MGITLKHITLLLTLTLYVANAAAQAPSAELLIKVQDATTSEINSITGEEQGMLVYDNEKKILLQFDGTDWTPIENLKNTVILNRNGGNNALQTNNNTYSDFPLTPANTQANIGTAFTVEANGHITIEETGQYLLSAALSSSNLPQGTRKYILGVFRNGGLIGYLSRGFVTQPQAGTDFWGASGTLVFTLNANDDIAFRYVINNNGNPLNAVFVNTAITKI